MLTLRRSSERGRADHGWLRSQHSFSFADYFDPEHTEYSVLRVINEDEVQPGQGFGTHGHRDMEIISYVLEGELEHRDSMGNGSVMRPGDVQRMSAGRGVLHSEYNPSPTHPVHFLQIWLRPAQLGVAPSYEQKHFETAEKRGRLRLIASPEGAGGSLRLNQDARLHVGLLDGTERATLALAPGRCAYVHVARGRLRVNGSELGTGDAARIEDSDAVTLDSGHGAEVLVFDLPGPGAR